MLGGDVYKRQALQTREQHIKREKATSNICTSQVLLAIMSGMYAVYHGADGLKNIATRIHQSAVDLSAKLAELGFVQENKTFFDTIKLSLPKELTTTELRAIAEEHEINFSYYGAKQVGISVDETTNICLLYTSIQVLRTWKYEDTTLNYNSAPEVLNMHNPRRLPVRQAGSLGYQ